MREKKVKKSGIFIFLAIVALTLLAVIISEIDKFITAHPGTPYLLVIILFIVAAILVYKEFKQMKDSQETRKQAEIDMIEAEEYEKRVAQQEEEARIEKEKERQQEIVFAARKFLHNFKNILTECLVIDTNIWMTEEYDDFFVVLRAACKQHKYSLILYGPQFDEVVNIKNRTEYEKTQNRFSRMAISRIERFQKEDLLDIAPVTIDAKRGAYADPLIVKLLTQQAQKGVSCTFISDDKELRIRVRQHLKDLVDAKWKIVEMKDILPGCKTVIESFKYKTIFNT